MRALAYFGKGNIRFTNHLKEPHIVAPDELVIDIAWCGICGTDLHEYTDGPIFSQRMDTHMRLVITHCHRRWATKWLVPFWRWALV